MKNNVIIDDLNDEIAIQYSETFVLNNKLTISVPNGYIAYAIIEGKPICRIEPCEEKSVMGISGKDYKNSKIRFLYSKLNFSKFYPWGFGPVPVKNDKLNETYRIGAHGSVKVKIIDSFKLINAIGANKVVYFDDIDGFIKPIIATIGMPLLSTLFADSKVSLFEANSYTKDLQDLIGKALKNSSLIKDAGLEVLDVLTKGMHVNDEDYNLIKDNINKIAKSKADKAVEMNQSYSSSELDQDLIISEIDNLRNEVFINNNKMKNIDALLEEISSLKKEIAKSNSNKDSEASLKEVSKMIKESEEKLKSGFDKTIQNIKNIVENKVIEELQESMPLYTKADEKSLKKIKLTTDVQLENAETDDDYAGISGLIYSNVEYNLINKFKVNHSNKNFYMTLDEFNDFADEFQLNDKKVFKDIYKPKSVKVKNNNEECVEMPVECRFYQAGLSIEDSLTAAKLWSILNMMRHRSKENEKRLSEILKASKLDKKSLLKQIVMFYREKGLYSRD